MRTNSSPKVSAWLPGPMGSDLAKLLDRVTAIDDVLRVALMPDLHPADGVAVGMVVATKQGLYPDAVGGDAGCGMCAVRLSGRASMLRNPTTGERILGGLAAAVPAGKWPRRQSLPPGLLDGGSPTLRHVLERDGAVEFGTLGRGNHFLEIQADDQDDLWLMAHSGSRALGPWVRERYRRAALDAGPAIGTATLPGIIATTDLGQDYLADLDLALRYANANRARLFDQALEVLHTLLAVEPHPDTLISCVHNFVRSEDHQGTQYWVHRKGSLSAKLGEPGIIPGSMGAESFLVTGRGYPDSLCSSSHGAGRAMSRKEASQHIKPRRLEREMSGIVYPRGEARRLCDEAPSAYKPVGEVMRAQRELTRVERRLRPLVVYKGV